MITVVLQCEGSVDPERKIELKSFVMTVSNSSLLALRSSAARPLQSQALLFLKLKTYALTPAWENSGISALTTAFL